MIRDFLRALSQILFYPAIACWLAAIVSAFFLLKRFFKREWRKGITEFIEVFDLPMIFAAAFFCMIFDTEEKGIAGARVLLFLLGLLYVASTSVALSDGNWMMASILIIGIISMFYSVFGPNPLMKKKEPEEYK